MIPENVTLTVKAPNQQIEDQNIECQSAWTVRQLKGHLSEVYPTKPSTEKQKIIYAGQLLDDNTVLKNVLRTYDSQISHTMHLVCTPSRKMDDPINTPDPEGLRRRNVEQTPPEVIPRAETSQNQQNHTVEMQNYLNTAMNNYGRVPPYPNYNLNQPIPQDAASMANQMMMMQQAYVQYMQQYALWQASIRDPPPPAPAPAPEPPAADDEEPRDWLDNLYAASRLAILSSLIYVYGSGARLLLVLVLALAGYLHQIGFFRDLNLHRLQNANENQPANQGGDQNILGNRNQPANQNQPDNQNPPGNPNQAGNVNQPGNQNPGNLNQPGNQNQPAVAGNTPADRGNQPQPAVMADDQRSLLSVTWMIFSTFFASLIPEANQ